MNLIGAQLQQQGMVINDYGTLERKFARYLGPKDKGGAGVDWNPDIDKTLDTNHTITDQKKVGGLTSQDFFVGNDSLGIPFLPNNQEHMLIWYIRVSEVVDAGDPDQVAYVPGVAGALVQQGRMLINTNGVDEMNNKILNTFVRAEEEPYSGTIMLPRPIIWEAQTKLRLTITWANAPAADTNLQIDLGGWKLIGG